MEEQVRKMETITLDQMGAVKLMNRVDQKFMTNKATLPLLLERITPYYYVQRIDGVAVADYRTLYFDTKELAMYTHHHNRKKKRQKLRIRTYRSTQTTFFELKNKDNKGKTRKTRIPVDVSVFDKALQQPEVSSFVVENTPYPIEALHEQVENFFSRLTLVDKKMTERVTIDYNINFHNRHTGIDKDISELVIIEVKHEVGAPKSAIEEALLELRVHPKRVSKYCIGTVLTNPNAKYNRFKMKIRYIDKLIEASQQQKNSITINN